MLLMRTISFQIATVKPRLFLKSQTSGKAKIKFTFAVETSFCRYLALIENVLDIACLEWCKAKSQNVCTSKARHIEDKKFVLLA